MSILSRLAASALAVSAFAMSSPSYGTSYTTLYTFTAGTNGADPLGGLNIDSKGNLFGTAYGGVDWFQEAGTVFELSPVSNSLTPKYTEAALHAFFSFNGDGAYPYAGLVFDAAGNLYGTTCDGGPTGLGAIFRLNRPGNSITILHGFDDATEGHCPQAGLTFDSNGFLYGTVSRGGANGGGSLFKFNPASLKLTVLHSFAGPDGSEPVAGVVLDSAGSLYGTTYGGGANGAGTVYKFNQLTGGQGYSKLVLSN